MVSNICVPNTMRNSSWITGLLFGIEFESNQNWIFPIYRNWKSEVFPIDGNQIMGVVGMLEVTRGQVDNENNSQSQYLNILNNIQNESLIYESESIAIRNGKYWNMGWNTARQ